MLEIGCAWSKGSGERPQGHHGPLVPINSLRNEKYLDWSKLKAFEDDKIKRLKSSNLVWVL